MRVLRLFLAGLIGVAAMVAVFFAAAFVFFAGLVAYVVQLFGGKSRGPAISGRSPATNRQPTMRADDAIDVEATRIPTDPKER